MDGWKVSTGPSKSTHRAARAREGRITHPPTKQSHASPPPHPYRDPHVTRGRLNTQRLAPYDVGLMAEGDDFTEETLELREAVIEGTVQEDVLHGVLYS
jgi:hypothetical protein